MELELLVGQIFGALRQRQRAVPLGEVGEEVRRVPTDKDLEAPEVIAIDAPVGAIDRSSLWSDSGQRLRTAVRYPCDGPSAFM
jgi:hypothetical protein